MQCQIVTGNSTTNPQLTRVTVDAASFGYQVLKALVQRLSDQGDLHVGLIVCAGRAQQQSSKTPHCTPAHLHSIQTRAPIAEAGFGYLHEAALQLDVNA